MSTSISFAGFKLEFHPERVLWIPELELLCASDMHFGKGSFFSRFATFLPPYDSHDTLEKLTNVITRFKPRFFIALGDSFHDKHAGERLGEELKTQLNNLIHSTDRWVWVMGNHDPEIDSGISGQRHQDITVSNITFRHAIDATDNGFEVSGHFHPKVNMRVKGHSIGGPCFVRSHKRLIMPAFGSYTGGLSIHSQDFINNLPSPIEEAFLIQPKAVYPLRIGNTASSIKRYGA